MSPLRKLGSAPELRPGAEPGGLIRELRLPSVGRAEPAPEQAAREAIEAARRTQSQAVEAAGRLAAALHEVASLRARTLEQAACDAADLALAVASAVLERELGADRDALIDLVRRGARALGERDAITVRAAPAAAHALSDRLAEVEAACGAARVTVIEDAALGPGCVVESERARVDATIARLLADLAAAWEEPGAGEEAA